ncbi:hypothetical protein ANN_12808 [Periplaneta americana]|uniref:Uncharacterized protein n=1 Tax=Periplaneta americana TaxID=6978 RepID=A0ABQ8TJK9_PERAM|nr:hypothetical protein ANN_12808 [Periplaneta americana]
MTGLWRKHQDRRMRQAGSVYACSCWDRVGSSAWSQPRHTRSSLPVKYSRLFSTQRPGTSKPVAWPPRSPELIRLEFFLWSKMGMLGPVRATLVSDKEDLKTENSIVLFPIFDRVRQAMNGSSQ